MMKPPLLSAPEAIASVKVCDKMFPFVPDCLKVVEALVPLPFQVLVKPSRGLMLT
ncbi:MAG: hypothetical protein WBA57_03370 [Elainellaceae cyanobacterium]